jgi:hypothetical protein
MAFEVPMAARPATPQPKTKVWEGGYLPREMTTEMMTDG